MWRPSGDLRGNDGEVHLGDHQVDDEEHDGGEHHRLVDGDADPGRALLAVQPLVGGDEHRDDPEDHRLEGGDDEVVELGEGAEGTEEAARGTMPLSSIATTRPASTRGATRRSTGERPSTLSASISSLMLREPRSAQIA